MKKMNEEEVIRRVAYEVSVSKLELIDAMQSNVMEEQPTFRVLTT